MWGSGSHDPGSNPGGTTNSLVPRRVEFVDQRVLVFDPAGREYATSMSVGPEPHMMDHYTKGLEFLLAFTYNKQHVLSILISQ